MSDLETLKEQHPKCPRCGTPMERSIVFPDQMICPFPESACQAIAAMASKLQQHKATIAELMRHKARMRDLIVSAIQAGVDPWFFREGLNDQDFEEFESVSDAYERVVAEHNLLHRDLAAAQATIQQQARELEEADEALISVKFSWATNAEELEDWVADVLDSAWNRHSARAQQAEAKKEEE